MPVIRDFSQGYHTTTTYRHVEAPIPAYEIGDLLLAIVSLDDSATSAAQNMIGGMPVPYVFYNDDAAWTDYTVQANDNAINDWYMSPLVPTTADACSFGSLTKFNQLNVFGSTAGAGGTAVFTFEYYNGAWVTLTTTTNTFASLKFANTVHAECIFTPPADWTTVAVNGTTAYWIRYRCTTGGTFTTRPIANQAWIFPVPENNNCWRQLFAYYGASTPAPVTALWKIATASEVDTTFFYVTVETADVELISIRDVQATVDSGLAALTVNVTASTRKFIRTTGSWATNGFAVGMQIQPSGFTNAANNYIRQIESITTTTNANDTITVTSGTSLVDETGNNNERIIAYPFNSNITGGGTGSTYSGYTNSNASAQRTALPQITTTKDDCLLIYSASPDGVAVPSIIEGPCQLIAGKDGSGLSDGMAWGYLNTAAASPNNVYLTSLSSLSTDMAVVAINPPHGGAAARPAYGISDSSVYISPFTGAAYASDSAPVNTLVTTFAGRTNGNPTVNSAATTYTQADSGLNSYHAMAEFSGVTTSGSWSGFRTVIASRDFSGKNILFHIQPYLPVDIQTTDSVSLLGTCGVAIGFASATNNYKIWHVGGSGVYGDTQRHQPVVIHPDATAGILSHAGSFAVSGGSGTFVAGNRLYVGASWAAATKRAYITSVSGSSPTQTITYATIGDWSKLDFASSNAVVEWTAANANGATGTAGTVTSLNKAAVVSIATMLSGKVVVPDWLICSVWALDTWTVVGGIAAEPITLPQIVSCYASGHERRSAIQQGAKQALFLGPIQIGDGTNFTYLNLDGTAIEFPNQYDKDAKQVFYNSIDNFCGLIYYAASGNTITHKNSVVSSGSRFKWGLHASFSTSVTPDFSGLSVIGAGTITLNRAVTVTGLTINDYSTIDASGLTFDQGIIKNVPTTSASITTTTGTLIKRSAIDVSSVASGNYWVTTTTPVIFENNTWAGGGGHAIRITTAGSYAFVGNVFNGFGANGSNGAAIFNDSGGSVTLTISGGGSSPTYRNGTSATTTIVAGSVTVSVTVKDSSSPPVAIQNAKVLLVADSGGPFPTNVTVTISRVSNTATVAHSSHGLATNDKIQIKGANEVDYNGVFSITYIDPNSYSYTVANTPSTPATGTIKASFVCLYGDSDVNGLVTTSRVYGSNQPFIGRVRKSSGAPYYKTSPLADSINSTTGYTNTVQLILDS